MWTLAADGKVYRIMLHPTQCTVSVTSELCAKQFTLRVG